jgi:plasmid stabilization system protein ParE
MRYFVQVTEEAKEDIERVFDYIENNLFAPVAAEKFLRGIYAEFVRNVISSPVPLRKREEKGKRVGIKYTIRKFDAR